jgi:hypothetical protein
MDYRKILMVGFGTLLAGTTAQAGYFDGKHQLLCTAQQSFQCESSGGCQAVSAEDVGGQGRYLINFKKKTVTSGNPDSPLKTTIENQEIVDNTMFIQGIEDGSTTRRDGAAWGMSINSPDGVMVLSVAAGDVSFTVLGACTPYDG